MGQRQTDRETDRQTDRQADRQAGRQRHRRGQKGVVHAKRETDEEGERLRGSGDTIVVRNYYHRDTQRETHTDGGRDRQTDRQTETERQRQRQTERDGDRERAASLESQVIIKSTIEGGHAPP